MNQDRAAITVSGPEQTIRIGILFILTTSVMFALLDTGVKYVGQFYPVLQIAWARYVFQMAMVPLVIGRIRPRDILRTRRPGLQVARSLLMVGATLSFFTAVNYMPVAEASAIGMIAPLMVTTLATPMLGERVGPRRWMAVVIGLIGALIIIRPGFGSLSWAAILPVITAICYALYQITTRMLADIDLLLFRRGRGGGIEPGRAVRMADPDGRRLGDDDRPRPDRRSGAFLRHPGPAPGAGVGAGAVQLHPADLGDDPGLSGIRRLPGQLHPARRGHRGWQRRLCILP
jgi:uncharacterized membrane protein